MTESPFNPDVKRVVQELARVHDGIVADSYDKDDPVYVSVSASWNTPLGLRTITFSTAESDDEDG